VFNSYISNTLKFDEKKCVNCGMCSIVCPHGVFVLKEKKAEMIVDELTAAMAEVESLEDLASRLNLSVSEASDISFNSYSIPGAGIEPAVIATAANSPMNLLSDPITGTNGVYVISVNDIQEPDSTDIENIHTRLVSSFRVRANYEAFEALKKSANIVDSRTRFY